MVYTIKPSDYAHALTRGMVMNKLIITALAILGLAGCTPNEKLDDRMTKIAP